MTTRILGCLREEDTLSRYGGDGFALLLPDVNGQHGVATVVEKILKEVRKSFHINEHELQLSLSIGIAIYPSTVSDLDILQQNVDTAMCHVKTHSKDSYCFYSDNISRKYKNVKIPLGDPGKDA